MCQPLMQSRSGSNNSVPKVSTSPSSNIGATSGTPSPNATTSSTDSSTAALYTKIPTKSKSLTSIKESEFHKHRSSPMDSQLSQAAPQVQRSANTTPHHHYYSPNETPHFIKRASPTHLRFSPVVHMQQGLLDNQQRTTPTQHLYSAAHNQSSKSPVKDIRKRNQSPSSNISSISANNLNTHCHMSNHQEYLSSNIVNSTVTNGIIACNLGLNIDNNNGSGDRHIANLSKKKKSIPPPPTTIIIDDKNKDQKEEEHKSTSQEFLPICDALFNIISLAIYFCDIVFDVLSAYSFYNDDEWPWFVTCACFISTSVVLSQILSLKWYIWNENSEKKGKLDESQRNDERAVALQAIPPCRPSILIPMHILLCGVLYRYFKLFIPVDLRFVKSEVRDLCLLRLVHGFCQAAPMLLLQLYLIWLKPGPEHVTDLNIVSTALSLCSVCWALASFSKNIRRHNVHKLVLTWLGVIFQFIWRLGTITSRVVALSVYATVYHYWVFLVLGLHWLSMLLWLISPKNSFKGERLSTSRKVCYSALIAIVYTFCYINVQEHNSRQKVIIYYVTMFLENSLLLSVWLIAVRSEETILWFKELASILVFSCFVGGILFMCLYYRYVHVKKLSYVYETGTGTYSTSSSGYRDTLSLVNGGGGVSKSRALSSNNKSNYMRHHPNGSYNGVIIPNGTNPNNRPIYNKINGHHIHHPNSVPLMPVQGVFNCRFNPAMKRKKKKPTTFIPPPAVPNIEQQEDENQDVESVTNKVIPTRTIELSSPNDSMDHEHSFDSVTGKIPIIQPPSSIVSGNGYKLPNGFWKRPLSITMGSDNDRSSVGSRVDIQQKLQEKKQQQLADLREIEEEIKQGKLKRPHISEIPESNVSRQPVPFEKKQPWFRSNPVQIQRPPIIIPPNCTNEVVLDPTYLMMYSNPNPTIMSNGVSDGYYEQPDYYYEPVYQNDEMEQQKQCNGKVHKKKFGPGMYRGNARDTRDSIYKSYRCSNQPSDIDSQMSLPRSYTLPREFKIRKMRKPIKNETFLPSTNSYSSDGDVDSGEEDKDSYAPARQYPLPLPSVHQIHMPNTSKVKKPIGGKRNKLHETKL